MSTANATGKSHGSSFWGPFILPCSHDFFHAIATAAMNSSKFKFFGKPWTWDFHGNLDTFHFRPFPSHGFGRCSSNVARFCQITPIHLRRTHGQVASIADVTCDSSSSVVRRPAPIVCHAGPSSDPHKSWKTVLRQVLPVSGRRGCQGTIAVCTKTQ
jgi:hypothetical protein